MNTTVNPGSAYQVTVEGQSSRNVCRCLRKNGVFHSLEVPKVPEPTPIEDPGGFGRDTVVKD